MRGRRELLASLRDAVKLNGWSGGLRYATTTGYFLASLRDATGGGTSNLACRLRRSSAFMRLRFVIKNRVPPSGLVITHTFIRRQKLHCGRGAASERSHG